MADEGISLREKKFARTKISIMNAFIERMKKCRFDDISIRDVCRELEISEGTFFNYFPEKLDIVHYYMNLVTIKLIWSIRKQSGTCTTHIDTINRVFDVLPGEFGSEKLMYEFLSVIAAYPEMPRKVALSALELQLAFPDCAGIEGVPLMMLEDFLEQCVNAAVENGELQPKTDVGDVVMLLLSIMIGAMYTMKSRSSKRNLKCQYQRNLHYLWKGIGKK